MPQASNGKKKDGGNGKVMRSFVEEWEGAGAKLREM
jgi:hypothetical protein